MPATKHCQSTTILEFASEIDEIVVQVAKQFLPSLAAGFQSPKLELHIGDGLEFLKAHQAEFDVVITDSSDPIGPAEPLFGKAYYELVHQALTERGVLASQAESIWLHLPLIQRMVQTAGELFPSVAYASASVPTYPSGCIGYLLASKQVGCVWQWNFPQQYVIHFEGT